MRKFDRNVRQKSGQARNGKKRVAILGSLLMRCPKEKEKGTSDGAEVNI
jgi:hypothetical protein